MGDDDSASVRIPDALREATDEDLLREKREREVIRDIEARLRAGEITVAEADEELVALALERFEHFSEATQAALKSRSEAMLEASPEIVESRASIAAAYDAESGNDESVR
ncbi:MAG: hypothetical protein SangKO_067510 [Sandaracinaceae bacterium]